MAKQNPEKEFVISHTFNVPREVLWKAFTDPKEMAKWWGPKGAKILSSKMDLRPGGMYHYGMEFSGQKMWGKFIYREIKKPEKIILVSSFSDEKGGTTRHPMSKDWPLEMLSTFTFDETSGKTKMTVKWIPLNATPAERKAFAEGHQSMTQGWTGTFEQLGAYLSTSVVEIAQFKAKPGVSDEELLAASQSVHDNYLSKCKGYVSRELLKAEDGTWLDMVRFETLEDARNATDNFEKNPHAKSFDGVLLSEKMMRFRSAKKY